MMNKNIQTFCDEVIGDGITYRYLVTHMLNSFKILTQIVQEDNGMTLSSDKYILIRKSPNNIIVEFSSPPVKNEKFYILLVKVE